ncbi:MAG TPA: carbon-nitrogen hydrolase family protein [Steroidobacteraceae bacterium]|nr:carbon-nitrogen hydrolase family protein [Steroidobacteraceae bacterium]
MSRFGIAALQLDLPNADNLERLDAEIDTARRRFPWVDMVIIGELASFGPSTALAQPLPGAAEARLCAAAARNNLWLVPGTLFEKRGGRTYNTAPVIDPGGKVVARYSKMFPFLPYESGVTAGSEFVVFDVPQVGRFGVSICYDMWFPETTRSLAWMGAEVILHPSMTSTVDRDAELAIGRANATVNQCYFVDVNVAGNLGVGRSAIFGPGGELVCQAGAGREILAVELDLQAVRSARTQGWLGLTQPLKSFRDSVVEFAPYALAVRRSPYLDSLGPLNMPTRAGRMPT